MLLTRSNTALGNPFTQNRILPAAQTNLVSNPAGKPSLNNLHHDVFFSARPSKQAIEALEREYQASKTDYERITGLNASDLEQALRGSVGSSILKSKIAFQKKLILEMDKRVQQQWGSVSIWRYFDEGEPELPHYTTQQQDKNFGRWLAEQPDKAQQVPAFSEAFQKKHGEPYSS
jgi:hypothetical protein